MTNYLFIAACLIVELPGAFRESQRKVSNRRMEETNQTPQAPELGPGGVPKDAKTSEYYRTSSMPPRFDNPGWFQGYESKPQHPMYITSSSEYGRRQPSVHTMPTCFHAKSQQFSEQLGLCGMYRNHSLNTGLDQHRC